MDDSSSTQSITSSQSDSRASSRTLSGSSFEMSSPSSPIMSSIPSLTESGRVDSHARRNMLQEPRLEAPYFPGQPSRERKMQSLARLDIVLQDLQQAFAGQSQQPRVEAPYFPGQPPRERMESLARLDIVLADLERVSAGQSHGRDSQGGL
ncbi:uncharacterized protein Z519_03076 [Cladophialophora bantiana CBS 173.52]|uniref:Uncharacterized protein n=1 Tax=Cladophialophora bantiana (strain ATCC 10958 / CBS 173.52 / CDC B-1940 / NIH 8579) TaxID=1442370 RepID=A0A0D2HYN9_CLAB1|nr:uncharacterized protein Z519_03076 [Cladophialophora bantiana CBS 173.52]KIW96010.1 hypothetical protein Z519_03076 [Cladophialophora bantiana CBS 173.52]